MRRRWLHGQLRVTLGIFTLLTLSRAARADLSVGSLTSAQVPGALAGPGALISNVTLSGPAAASGSFSGGDSVLLGVDRGVVLSSGLAATAVGPNDHPVVSQEWNTVGDAQLASLLNSTVLDASVLSFNVTCPAGIALLRLDYVFASEEYTEGGPGFPDGIGIFIDGVNAATVPGLSPATPVHTNSLSEETPSLFHDNVSNACYLDLSCPYNLQANGFSVKLTASAAITPGVSHQVKIAIGDAAALDGDSWVFLSSLSCGAAAPPARVPLFGATPALLGLGSALLALASVVAGRRTRRSS